MIAKLIEIGHVSEEKLTSDIGRSVRAVHVNFFILAVVRAQPNYITLIGNNKANTKARNLASFKSNAATFFKIDEGFHIEFKVGAYRDLGRITSLPRIRRLRP
jgi:hypothetical protein